MVQFDKASANEVLKGFREPIVVVGLGKTGFSCVEFLSLMDVSFEVVDTRDAPPFLPGLREVYPDVVVRLGPLDSLALEMAGTLIVSPGVCIADPAIEIAKAAGADIVGDVEIFARLANAPVLAVTGSNGKSTVTTLLADMIAASGYRVLAGGNLGTPVLEILVREKPDFYVIELSSFQLETTGSLDAVAATVLNISADHMDRYTGLEEYILAKRRIFSGTGWMILNRDDSIVRRMVAPDRNVFTFGLCAPANDNEFGVRDCDGEQFLAKGDSNLVWVGDVKVPGQHNLLNCLSALALGFSVGLNPDSMAGAIHRFTGLDHRTQWVAEVDGISWFNDSKGTNIGACAAAISGMPGSVVLIAGGDGKGSDFSPLREVAKGKVTTAILMGQDAAKIAAVLEGEVKIELAANMVEAVQIAAKVATPGEAVLLSPACASFDMYTGYADRGNAFVEAVKQHVIGC